MRTAPQGGGSALVNVDFRAVTSAGSPIADLKVGDVTLKVEGRERAIRSFELLPIGDKPAGPARSTLPPPFATNTIKIEGTRDTLLVLDDELHILTANPAFNQTFTVNNENLTGQSLFAINNSAWERSSFA